MRALLFTTDYLPKIGGIAAHVYELGRALHQAGHHVTVMTTTPAGAFADPQFPRVIRVRDRLPWLRLTRGRRVQFLATALRPLLSTLGHYDLVHFHSADAISRLCARLWASLPQVATNHTSAFVSDFGDPQRAEIWRRFLLRMRRVLAPSQEIAALTVKLGLAAEQTHYLPNGVDASRFHPGVEGKGFRESQGFSADTRLILCPRRLVAKNGCITLARALPRLLRACPEARLLFAGEGPERGAIEAELAALGVRAQASFAGSVPNATMPMAYAAADIVVVPSLVEATSIAALEAMATARPVVASRVGGLPALIAPGETGYLVPPADPEQLGGALCRLLSNPRRRVAMGEAARRRVEAEFTWQEIADRTVRIYEAALERTPLRLGVTGEVMS
jgi:glycosyltransferase involved in cell wall biosynthesis